ncbi:MAG: nucleoside hydrolase [Bacteroidota bacterium]
MKKVWIDTDVAITAPDARGGVADVDDAYAMVQLFHAPNIMLRGISTVFGNTFIENSTPIAANMVANFGPTPSVQVYMGAKEAMELNAIEHNNASLALKQTLEREKLHILAIGPATNIGILLLLEPHLASQIEEVVLVAGRRSLDQHFQVGPKQEFPFHDLNFDLDPNAFRILLQSGVNIVLHPFEISHKIWIDQSDLDDLATGCKAAQFLAKHSVPWLNQWKPFDVEAFNPFDVLASAYLVDESWFEWDELPAQLVFAPDDTQGNPAVFKPYFILHENNPGGRKIRYCHSTKDGFKEWLLEMLKTNPN